MRAILFLIITLFLGVSCDKKCGPGKFGQRLDIYFLKDYKTKPQSDVIISGSEVLSDEIAISYDEIIS